MIFNVHAGHNPDGKIACGAVGLIRESTEARKVKNRVIELLRSKGHTVYDCTVSNGISQGDVLSRIVKKCNSHKVNLDISIHFNAGRNDSTGDGTTGGTEVFVYSHASKAGAAAKRICSRIAGTGFQNRGVKANSGLYILRKTSSPALLIECCFVDDADDVTLYNPSSMAQSIVEGILDTTLTSDTNSAGQDTFTPAKQTPLGNFKIKVTDNALNIRAGAGTSHKITGCIRDKGIYTITRASGSWGYLKSGAGWICISTKFVKYL